MWIITYRRNPATIQQIYDAENKDLIPRHVGEGDTFMCGRTRASVEQKFWYHTGVTWKYRADDIGIRKLEWW